MSKVPGDTTATPTVTVETQEPPFQDRFKTWTPEQKAEWSRTGNEPEISAPAKPKEETPAATPKEEAPKPEPEAGPEKEIQEPKRERYETRQSRRDARKIGELTANNRKLERELEELRKARSSNPSAEVTERVANRDGRPVRPEEPELADYDTIEEFQKARKEYKTKLADYDDKVEEWRRKQWESERAESTEKAKRETESKARIEKFDQLAGEFQKTLKDADTKTGVSAEYEDAFQEVLEALKDAEAETVVRDTLIEIGPAAVHYLGTHTDELDRILGLSTPNILRELGKIEATLAKAPKPITQTRAAAPGTRLSASTQATGDPIEDAYARGDFKLGAKLEAERDAKIRR